MSAALPIHEYIVYFRHRYTDESWPVSVQAGSATEAIKNATLGSVLGMRVLAYYVYAVLPKTWSPS